MNNTPNNSGKDVPALHELQLRDDEPVRAQRSDPAEHGSADGVSADNGKDLNAKPYEVEVIESFGASHASPRHTSQL